MMYECELRVCMLYVHDMYTFLYTLLYLWHVYYYIILKKIKIIKLFTRYLLPSKVYYIFWTEYIKNI